MASHRLALLFPGQGAQAVGMGKALYETYPEAREVFDQFVATAPAETQNLLDVMFDGPEDLLKQTQYTQPAILAVSLAAWAVLRAQFTGENLPIAAAGHSLGEYAALTAAGVISVETAARLIHQRAQAMQSAPTGAMAAVLGLSTETLHDLIAQQSGICVIANDNTPDQKVISGTPEAVSIVSQAAQAAGASKVIPLVVGGAFHSPLMQPACDRFAQVLSGVDFAPAQFEVVSNIDAKPSQDPQALKDKLSKQIAGTVQWTRTTQWLIDQNIDLYIELGPGKVLSGMLKRQARQATLLQAGDPAGLEAIIQALSALPVSC